MVAERIRAEIALVFERSKDGEPVVVTACTASIGVAIAEQRDVDLQELLKSTGTAVYAAKEGGRDRVVLTTADRDATIPDSMIKPVINSGHRIAPGAHRCPALSNPGGGFLGGLHHAW